MNLLARNYGTFETNVLLATSTNVMKLEYFPMTIGDENETHRGWGAAPEKGTHCA